VTAGTGPHCAPSGQVTGRFLVPGPAAGPAVVVERGSPVRIPEDRREFIVIVKSWDPAQVLTMAEATGAVILSRSPKSHAAVAALHLSIPSCCVEPENWTARIPARVELRHAEGLVLWKPLP